MASASPAAFASGDTTEPDPPCVRGAACTLLAALVTPSRREAHAANASERALRALSEDNKKDPAFSAGACHLALALTVAPAPSQRPETPSLPGWSVAWSRFRGCYLFVSADGQVARETSPDTHMNPEEAAAAARSTSGDGQA